MTSIINACWCSVAPPSGTRRRDWPTCPASGSASTTSGPGMAPTGSVSREPAPRGSPSAYAWDEQMAQPADRRRVGRAGRGPTVTDEAIAKIREIIVSGHLGPGDRLPREADLAVQLGLSRNSLREAIRALSLVRVLDVRQGDGTYVSSLEPELLLETTGFVAHLLRDRSVLDLFEVRRLLEPAAAALSAVRMDDEARRQLRVELDRMLEADGVAELVDADSA